MPKYSGICSHFFFSEVTTLCGIRITLILGLRASIEVLCTAPIEICTCDTARPLNYPIKTLKFDLLGSPKLTRLKWSGLWKTDSVTHIPGRSNCDWYPSHMSHPR